MRNTFRNRERNLHCFSLVAPRILLSVLPTREMIAVQVLLLVFSVIGVVPCFTTCYDICEKTLLVSASSTNSGTTEKQFLLTLCQK
jgi:hypothetical protein